MLQKGGVCVEDIHLSEKKKGFSLGGGSAAGGSKEGPLRKIKTHLKTEKKNGTIFFRRKMGVRGEAES